MTTEETMINATDLSFEFYQSEKIFENINLNLVQGELLGIIGPNGGGKSTLLKLIAGLLKEKGSYQGSLKINLNERAKLKANLFPISYLPQKEVLNLNIPITANEVIEMAKINNYYEKDYRSFTENEVYEQLNIQSLLKENFKNLSGGQRQRVLMARAVLINSPIILFDEPTKGLDSEGQDELMKMILKIKENRRQTMIIVDHNIQQVLRHSDKILCLNRTSHWHDNKELLNQNILNSIYHCEFEHQLIHETSSQCDSTEHKKGHT